MMIEEKDKYDCVIPLASLLSRLSADSKGKAQSSLCEISQIRSLCPEQSKKAHILPELERSLLSCSLLSDSSPLPPRCYHITGHHLLQLQGTQAGRTRIRKSSFLFHHPSSSTSLPATLSITTLFK